MNGGNREAERSEWEEWEEWPTWDKRGVCRGGGGEFGRLNIKAVRVVKWQRLGSERVYLEAEARGDKLPSVSLAPSRLHFQKHREIIQAFIYYCKKKLKRRIDQIKAKHALKMYLNLHDLIKSSNEMQLNLSGSSQNQMWNLKWIFVCVFPEKVQTVRQRYHLLWHVTEQTATHLQQQVSN